MAVETMKKVNIFACRKNRKGVLELLQASGAVEISMGGEDSFFSREDTSVQVRQFDENLNVLSAAVGILDRKSLEKKPFYLDVESISSADEAQARRNERDILQTARTVCRLSSEIAACETKIEQNRVRLIGLKPWLGFDYPLSFDSTKKTAVFIGSLPDLLEPSDLNGLLERTAKVAFHAETVSSGENYTCFVVIAHKKDATSMERALQDIGFTRAAVERQEHSPARAAGIIKEENRELEERIVKLDENIKDLCRRKHDLQILYDSFLSRREKYNVISKLRHTNRTFILTGYMPADAARRIGGTLETRYGAYLSESDPEEGEELPVKLKNNSFARPLEPIVESFSMPCAEDIDPTFVMSIFYYIYFGMMFSDAGYGLVVSVVCGLLGYVVKNVKPALKNSMRMFFFCGLSTFVWGILYGSFFGNAVSVVSEGFFHTSIAINPILFDPIQDPLRLLIISVAMGIVHILAGYVLKFVSLWRAGKRTDAICDAGFWLLLLGGISLMAVWIGMGAHFLRLPSIAFMAVGTCGLVLTAGRAHKNVVLRLLTGIVALYDLTGFLSDALSYSRLMALGLATGVIASVANLMSSLFGFGFPGGILFWIVFFAFHFINFAINMLGAYVHTNRLQYVEFFSKFYQGGGRKFEPFARKYIYTKMKGTDY